MPTFKVRDKSGNELKITQDHPPTKEELDYSFNQYYPKSEQPDDGVPFYLKPAEIPPSLKTTPEFDQPSIVARQIPPEPQFDSQAQAEGGAFGDQVIPKHIRYAPVGEELGFGYRRPAAVAGIEGFDVDPRAGEEIARQGLAGRFIEETAQAPIRIGMTRKNAQGQYETEMGPTEVVTGDEFDPRYHTALSVPLPTDVLTQFLPEGKLKDVSIGARNAVAGFLNFFGSPQGLVMGGMGAAGRAGGSMALRDAFKLARGGGDVMPLLQALREPANRTIAGAFAADMAKHAPEALQAGDDAFRNGDIAGAIEHWGGGVSQLVLAGMSAKHAVGTKTYRSPERMLAKFSAQMSLEDAKLPFQIRQLDKSISELKADPSLEGSKELQDQLSELTATRDQLSILNDERLDRMWSESTDPLSEKESAEYVDIKERLGAGEKLTAEQTEKAISYERRNRLNADHGKVNDIVGDIDNMLDEAISEQGVGNNVVKLDATDIPPGSPQSRSIAHYDSRTGKIVINTRALAADIADMPLNSQREYIKSMVNEEAIHSHTSVEEALRFLRNSTPKERAIARKLYGEQGKKLDDTHLALEMVRRRFQQINGIAPTEMALMVGPEGWSRESMEAFDRIIKTYRRIVDRKGTKEQQAVLKSVQEKVDLAKRMAKEGHKLEPQTTPGKTGRFSTPRRTTRADVENLGHEDFWKESMAWAKESMSSPEGISPQVRAEMAALTDKDLEGWKAAAAKAEAEAKAIRDEVMANPQSLGDVKVQQKFGGAAQKAQFFNEGLAMLTGDKKPDAKTLRLLAEGDKFGSPRKGRSEADDRTDFGEANGIYDEITRKVIGAGNRENAREVLRQEEEKLSRLIKQETHKMWGSKNDLFPPEDLNEKKAIAQEKKIRDLVDVKRTLGQDYWYNWEEGRRDDQAFAASPRKDTPYIDPSLKDQVIRAVDDYWRSYRSNQSESEKIDVAAHNAAMEAEYGKIEIDPFEDAIFNIASIPTSEWPLRANEKAALLKYFEQAKGTPHDREAMARGMVQGIEYGMEQTQAKLDMLKQFKQFKGEALIGKTSSHANNAIQFYEKKLERETKDRDEAIKHADSLKEPEQKRPESPDQGEFRFGTPRKEAPSYDREPENLPELHRVVDYGYDQFRKYRAQGDKYHAMAEAGMLYRYVTTNLERAEKTLDLLDEKYRQQGRQLNESDQKFSDELQESVIQLATLEKELRDDWDNAMPGMGEQSFAASPRKVSPEDERLYNDAIRTVLAAEKYKDFTKFNHEFSRAFAMARKIGNYFDAQRAHDMLFALADDRWTQEMKKRYDTDDMEVAWAEMARERDELTEERGSDIEEAVWKKTDLHKLETMVMEMANWIDERAPKPDRGESYQGDLFGSPRKDRSWYDKDVLMKDGTPITVFHGSPVDAIRQGELREPIFVSPDRGLARAYTGLREVKGGLYNRLERYGTVYPAHIKFSNPMYWKEEGGIPVDEARRIFKETDHDAIINEKGKEYAIKSPDQMIMIDDSGAPIMSPRKGMSKKAEKHIEELKKYRELMGQKPVEPQGPAAGSVSKRSAPASSRKPASAFFPPPTPESVEQSANYVLDSLVQKKPKLSYDAQGNVIEVGVERSFAPSFQRFVDDVRSKHGDVKSEQLREQWEDAVKKRLESATGEQLERMVDDLGLRREVFGKMTSGGGKDVFTAERTGKIADAGVDTGGIELARAKAMERAARLSKKAAQMMRTASSPVSELVKKTNPADYQRQVELKKELRQKAEILQRTANNLEAAAKSGEGLPAEQQTLFGGEEGVKPADFRDPTKGSMVRARERAQSVIYRRLMEDLPSMRAGLNRREISEEDIQWEETGADILRVTPEDLENLEKLGMELTRGAATDASTKRVAAGGKYTVKEDALPRSATKRVVALQNRKTGEVHLVSAYRDGRRGPVFRDPGSVTGEHRTLEQLIGRYRPMFSIPLNTPVQNFMQTFKSAADMHAKFSHRVDVAGRRIGWRGFGTTPPIEGTAGLEGEGGTFQGPERDIVSEWYDMTEGSREKGNNLTPQEARNIYDVFEPMETSNDAIRMISKLRERAEGSRLNQAANDKIERLNTEIDKLRELRSNATGEKDAELTKQIDEKRKEIDELEKTLKPELTANDWTLITAMTKVNRQLRIENAREELAGRRAAKKAGVAYEPKPVSVGMYEETLNTIYDLVQRNQTKQSSVRSLGAKFSQRHGPSLESGAEAPAESKTARELTMGKRRPPTDVSQAEPGQAYVPTGLQEGRPAGLDVPKFKFNPEREARRVSRFIRYQKLREGEPTTRRQAEPSSYPASGEDIGINQVKESYEMPEYRKRAIQRNIKEVAENIIKRQAREAQQKLEQAAQQQTKPQTPEQGKWEFGSPRKDEPGGEESGKKDYFIKKTEPRDPRMELQFRANPLDRRRLSERPAFWKNQWGPVYREITKQLTDIQKQITKELPLDTSITQGKLRGIEGNLVQFLRDSGLQFEGDKPVWETVRSDRLTAAENFYEALKSVRSLRERLPDDSGGSENPDWTVGSPRRDPATTVPELISNVMTDFGSIYDKWMVDRLEEYGGPLTRAFVRTARGIIDRQKELYGQLTQILDRARRLSGGIESFDPRISGPGVVGWVRDLPRRTVESARAMRAATWMHRIQNITQHTGVANSVRAVEGSIRIPRWAQRLVDMARASNLEVGRMFQPVSPGFVASGLWQRMLTGLGYDIIRQGGGVMWDRWIDGMVEANRRHGATRHGVLTRMRALKRILDDPMTTAERIEAVSQDMQRRYPEVVTHIRHMGRWHEVIHSNLFNYLEQTAQRASHVRAFREQFPMTPGGRTAWRNLVTQMRTELVPETNRDLDGLIRALNGHPTDEYGGGDWNDFARTNPGQWGNQALRMANQTINSLGAKMALTAQTMTQIPELMVGATPQKLGVRNYVRAMIRARQLYNELERIGAVNRVMHDYTLSPSSPLRSTVKAAGNVIAKTTGQAMFNELQEALAAATARVVTENILTGRLSYWERHMLPQTFREMGFSNAEAAAMMRGDQTLLNQFQRKAAAWLTGGNKAVAESSRMGAHRGFNSIFRFQTYPMMKMNQFRNTATQFIDAWATGRNRGAATTSLATFMFGTALQGAGLSMLSSLAFGGKGGFNVNKNEAKDQYWKFLGESFAAGMGGPLYILWRGARMGGWRGIGEQAVRTMFPYAMANEIGDFTDGVGAYSNKDFNQKLSTFALNRTPGLKMLGTGAAMLGIVNDNQELNEAIKGLHRWQRSEMGFDITQMSRINDDRADFRIQVKKALEAMKNGDNEAYTEAWLKAADLASSASFRRSVAKQKLLVDLDYKPLSDEMQEKLKKRIGMDAYERLEDWDNLVEAVAAGAMPAGRD